MERLMAGLYFLLSVSLVAGEAIRIPCEECDDAFGLEHKHDGNWLKKFASFDGPLNNIGLVNGQSFILFRLKDPVLEINFHDHYLREGNFVSVFFRNWIGTLSTPVILSLNRQRLLRILHTLLGTTIPNDNTWAATFALSNWEVFDFSVPDFENSDANIFRARFPLIDTIVFNLYPKNVPLPHQRKIALDDNFHPLVIGGIEPADDIQEIISRMKNNGITIEFHHI